MDKKIPLPLAISILAIFGCLSIVAVIAVFSIPRIREEREENERIELEHKAMLDAYSQMSYANVIAARNNHTVKTLDYDTCTERDDFNLCWVDDLTVEITNNSADTLPKITFRINRHIMGANEVSWSRTNYEFYSPLMPGESRVITLHAVGSLETLYDTIDMYAVIESFVPYKDSHFFPELKDKHD